ncbi:hypothetical protein NQ315_011784 [Exocentrus adspersus]|uniref:NADH dehydrogenase subunit 6 n=1 Tax=Exocentrus adspersus TaxID=1586481 RepID=A0AAV8W1L1_9CUCU|nr:hypothetical protein NQ315_011784 [Exocentrus adspersus]
MAKITIFNISEGANNSSTPYRKLRFSHLYWSSHIGNNFFMKSDNPDWGPIVIIPLLATIILAASVFLLIIFRQSPTFVISTIAVCLIFITVYLILCAMQTTVEILE